MIHEIRLVLVYTGPCRACLDYSVYILSMLLLHFLLVPSASDRSFWCQKGLVRHDGLGPFFTRFLWTWQLYRVWQSRVYPDYKALYLGIETHFWLDSWTVWTIHPSYHSPSTAPFTITITISHSRSLCLVHFRLPVSCSGHPPPLDYPLHLILRPWTSFRLLSYLESL